MFRKRKFNPPTWYDFVRLSSMAKRDLQWAFRSDSWDSGSRMDIHWTSTMDIHHHPRIVGLWWLNMAYVLPGPVFSGNLHFNSLFGHWGSPLFATMRHVFVMFCYVGCQCLSCIRHCLSVFSSVFDGQKTGLIVFGCWWTLLPVACLLLVTLVCPKTAAWSRGGEEGECRGVENQLKNLINALLFNFLSCVIRPVCVISCCLSHLWSHCLLYHFWISSELYVWVCFWSLFHGFEICLEVFKNKS